MWSLVFGVRINGKELYGVCSLPFGVLRSGMFECVPRAGKCARSCCSGDAFSVDVTKTPNETENRQAS